MSSSVDLYFLTELAEIDQSAHSVPVIRLFAWVSFATLDGFTPAYRAIIDTGSPVSIVPFNIWGGCAVELFGPDRILSFSGAPECEIPVQAGEITLIIFDARNQRTDELTIRADLCDTSEVPLILGMHDVLARGILHADYPRNQAWLEI